MGKISVGIIYGGRSVEHDVSLLSAKNILQNIDKSLFDVSLLAISKEGAWFLCDDINTPIEDGQPLSLSLSAVNPKFNAGGNQFSFDVLFPILHGTDGEDGSVQGLLQTIGLACVGSGVLGSAASMDKLLAKRVLQSADLPVSKFKAYLHFEKSSISFEQTANDLGLPLIVKPANLGSSVGVAKVNNSEEFDLAIENAFKYDNSVLIEEFIEGREVECGILGNDKPIATMAGEVVLTGDYDFYSFTAKYVDSESTNITIPAKMPESAHELIKELSLKAFKLLNCHDLARVDLFVKEDGSVFINEINTLPGFTNISMYPSLIQHEGIGYQELITKLINMALKRHEEQSRITTNYESRL